VIGRRFVIPLVVVGSVAVGGVAGAIIGVPGLSGASTPTSQTQAAPPGGPHAHCGRKSWLDAAAQALHLTTSDLRQKLSDGKTTIADVAAQQHVPVTDVTKAISDADQQCIHDFVNNPLPARPKGPGPGFGFARRGMLGAVGGELDAAAKALHLTTDQLMQDLRDGKSIADVANDQHVPVNDVVNAMVDAANARIDKAKDAGKLSADQANSLKAKLKDEITSVVNGKDGMRFGSGWKHGHMWPGGSTTSP
jgi:flagellar hook-basal body complex protein FliE